MANVVEIISSVDHDAINLLIKRVGKRLWLNYFGFYLTGSLKITACLILLLGVFHLTVQSLPVSYSLFFALFPVWIGLVLAVQKKPTELESAGYIDSQVNSQGLVATAVELIGKEKRENSLDYRPLIVHQAAQVSREWGGGFHWFRLNSPDKLTWLAGYVILLGIFFIMQPVSRLSSENKQQKLVSEITVKKTTDLSLFSAIKESQISKLTSDQVMGDFVETKKTEQSQAQAVIQKSNNSLQASKQKSLLNSEPVDGVFQKNEVINKQNVDGVGALADKNLMSVNNIDNLKLRVELVEMPLQESWQTNNKDFGASFKDQQLPNINNTLMKAGINKTKPNFVRYRSDFSPRQLQHINTYLKQQMKKK